MEGQQLNFTLAVELLLVTISSILLAQPEIIFAKHSQRLRTAASWSGMVFLCLTFCWSVILGVVIFLVRS